MASYSSKSNAVRAAIKAGHDPAVLHFFDESGRWSWMTHDEITERAHQPLPEGATPANGSGDLMRDAQDEDFEPLAFLQGQQASQPEAIENEPDLAAKAHALAATRHERAKAMRKRYRGESEKPAKGGSKTAIIADLLLGKDGTTRRDILTATGWPAVSVQAMARAAGLALRQEKAKGEPTRYYGARA